MLTSQLCILYYSLLTQKIIERKWPKIKINSTPKNLKTNICLNAQINGHLKYINSRPFFSLSQFFFDCCESLSRLQTESKWMLQNLKSIIKRSITFPLKIGCLFQNLHITTPTLSATKLKPKVDKDEKKHSMLPSSFARRTSLLKFDIQQKIMSSFFHSFWWVGQNE